MDNHLKLEATKRELLGKKSRALRHEGITPAHIFGHGVESLAVQCPEAELEKVVRQAGSTRQVSITVQPEREARNCFVREIQADAITRQLIHVDFYQVKSDEKIKSRVPLVLVGESAALKTKGTQLNIGVTSVKVECLPADVPAVYEVDLKKLAGERAIFVKDIDLGPGVTLRSDPAMLVAKIGLAKKYEFEEVKPKAKVEAGAPAVGGAAPAAAAPVAEKKAE